MHMIDAFHNVSIILGSKSPRRRELLSKLDIDFESISIDADESFDAHMPIQEVAEFLAIKKSQAYQAALNETILITSDTTVLCGDEILNKPANTEEAQKMLQLLSGNTHKVNTGVCLRNGDKQVSFNETTEVVFRVLNETEISYYINRYKPFDKAGSYGIQEWIGMTGITGINGCYYNVMGLPVSTLYKELCNFIRK